MKSTDHRIGDQVKKQLIIDGSTLQEDCKEVKILNCQFECMSLFDLDLEYLHIQSTAISKKIFIQGCKIRAVNLDAEVTGEFFIKNSVFGSFIWSFKDSSFFSGKCCVTDSTIDQCFIASKNSQFEVVGSKIKIHIDEYEGAYYNYLQKDSTVNLCLKNYSQHRFERLEFIDVGSIEFSYWGQIVKKISFKMCNEARFMCHQSQCDLVEFIEVKQVSCLAYNHSKIKFLLMKDVQTAACEVNKRSHIHQITVLGTALMEALSVADQSIIQNFHADDISITMLDLENSEVFVFDCRNLKIAESMWAKNANIVRMHISQNFLQSEMMEQFCYFENFKIHALEIGSKTYFKVNKLPIEPPATD